MIIGLPADFKLADLKSYLAEFGEIRRVDILKDETEGSEKSSSLTAEAEFARGDVAIVVFHKLLLSGYNGTAVRVGYSPSTGLTDAQGDVVPASAVEGGSNGRKDGNDTGDEADHEGERGGAGSRRSSQSSVAERGDISAQPLEPLATPVASSSGAHDYFASSSSEDETDIEVVEVSLVELDETSASVQSVDSVVSFDAPKPSSETPVPAAVLETSPPVAAVPKEE
ncbi:hypothetical protein DFJ73DRAFT_269032 [Zopfochytrium polystomum]|nr:hypothetical protein DFJ73DRAFT_269032 [Zopfochytrium polystomum]